MPGWTNATPEELRARARLDRSLMELVNTQLRPILAEVIATLRASGLPHDEVLHRSVQIVFASMTNIRRALGAPTTPSA